LNQGVGALCPLPLFDPGEKLLLVAREVVGLLEQMPEGNVRQVDADQRAEMATGKLFGHRAAPVAAMRRETFVAQLLGHQRVPHIADAERVARPGWLVGEPVAGQAGNDDVEGIRGVAAMCFRIGQHRNDLREAQEGIRIAVSEDDGQRPIAFAALVDEMDAESADVGPKMRETVDGLLLLPPIESRQPMIG
jgi:hypothetical protein